MDDREPNGPHPAAAGDTPAAGPGDATVGFEPAGSGGDTVALGDRPGPHLDSPLGDPDATRPVEPATGPLAAPHVASGTGDPGTGPTQPLAADSTQALPPVGGGATRALPPLRPAADTTVVFPQGEVPPYRRQATDSTAVGPPLADAWKGQAQVHPGSREEDSDQWGAPPPNRAWWLPILLGIAGLVLILAIAYALVVATRGGNGPAPAPSPSPSVTATPSTSAPPSTPPSTPPSSLPSGPPSGVIPIPAVLKSGINVEAAVQTLQSIGLKADPQPVVDPTHLEGTVVDTSPAVGALVQPGTVVTLYYAVPPPSSPPPSTPASTPPSGSPSASQSG